MEDCSLPEYSSALPIDSYFYIEPTELIMHYKTTFLSIAFAFICVLGMSQPQEGIISVEVTASDFKSSAEMTTFMMHATITPEPKWHVSSSKVEDAAYKPTDIYLDNKQSCVMTRGGVQEKGKLVEFYDDLMMGQMRYFESAVTFSVEVAFPPNCNVRNEVIILEYQACVDPETGGKCIFPVKEIEVGTLLRAASAGR